MVRAGPSRVRLLLLGAMCFGVGICLGRSGLHCLDFGSMLGRSHEPLWQEPPPVRTPMLLPSFADLVQQVGPGVVTVRVELQGPSIYTVVPPPAPVSSRQMAVPSHASFRNGSGFVVNAEGLVVTSRHVVDDARGIVVIVPRRGSFPAEMVGEDLAADLALLRLVGAPRDLSVLQLGDSDELRAGDWIVAVGNPFGFAQTVTSGVVSYVGRNLHHSDYGVTNDFIQSSAPVNPGSSGGPVFDLRGRVVGVTTQAPPAAQGISFAVPSRTLKWALEAMERQPDGRVRRGYLGIEFSSRAGVDENGEPREGALIVNVIDGEPAQRAGLQVGDVVLRVDGAVVPDARALHERIVHGDPGSQLALQLLRGGQIHDPIVAVLGEVGAPKHVGTAN